MKSRFLLTVTCCLAMSIGLMADDKDEAAAKAENKSVAAQTAPRSMFPADFPADLQEMFKLNMKYAAVSDWTYDAVRFPGVGDTIDREAGGLRPWLLKRGWNYTIQMVPNFQYNLANPPMYGANGPDTSGNYHPANPGTAQSYLGQRPTFNYPTYVYVIKNIGKNTQFEGCVEEVWTNGVFAYNVNTPRVCQMSLTQYLFDRKMKVIVGYQNDAAQFWGMYTAGNLAVNSLGMLATLPFAEGQANINMAAPAISVRYNFNSHFYSASQVQRSHSPISSTLNYHDMGNLRFSVKGAKANLTQEFGYKRAPGRGMKELWARVDGFYNFSHFNRWDSWNPKYFQFTKKTENNFGFYAGVDYQLTQPKTGIPARGLFVGGTVEYIPPQQNLYSQYYEFRTYYRGPMKSRQLDMITVGVNNLEYSKAAVKYLMTVKHATTSYSGQTNYTASYVAHVTHGMWWNAGVDYVNHPSTVPKTPNAFLASTGLAMFF